MLWEVDILAAEGQPDLLGRQVATTAAELGLVDRLDVRTARGFLLQGSLDRGQVDRIARELLVDRIVERAVAAQVGDPALCLPPSGGGQSLLVHVLPKPGVMDPVAQSVISAIADFGLSTEAVRTLKKYWIDGLPAERLETFASKVLANDAIEQVIIGPLAFRHLEVGSPYVFRLVTVPIRQMDDAALERLSREGQLFLSLVEMQTIKGHFCDLGRDPTDAELETIAQTWSEHCSHKTLTGRIRYRDADGERRFDNMLRETIFAATEEIRRQLGQDDWCVSVFRDNAGVIRFDENYNVVFKVETHNHPSALEPYGGANTGIGGVIRDPMGTGMGAKPVCNTDVFCFAPPDTPPESLPPGVLHPRRVAQGVVAGVRDYGNRMGIPTVNGAIYFDPRYLGNPLVYCGNIGLIPRDKSTKQPQAGDLIVAVGGRTGRDGIHGATFSSAELTSQSETVSGGAVQIGNAITEKMLLDVLLEARDRGLYHAVTDCGAGGFSSAVGEMGEKIGAEVMLERVPLKYEGLSYTEIWISEAQERMTLAVPEDKWEELHTLCSSEGVEATVIGTFVPTGRLVLKYNGQQVADLAMEFLHDGRPPVVREAVYEANSPNVSGTLRVPLGGGTRSVPDTLLAILASLNVCSKEWVIRQYDHEVQGGSVIKPLVGATNDGPSDAAVLRPVLDSRRGLVVACGMNPCYGDLDPYCMAAAAIDEAVRNCVAVGADPRRIAILDNFCWGNTDRPETLGSLVRAALACYDVATVLGTPFISGKDSLNNEFRPKGGEPISIPPSLLISALGQIDDVTRCVTMDLKEPGNPLYLVGLTRNELGGSHFELVKGTGTVCATTNAARRCPPSGRSAANGACPPPSGCQVPKVDPQVAKQTFLAVHRAIYGGLVRACHDLSEGGLAVAAAEMAFAGDLGARISLERLLCESDLDTAARLFSESNTRFLCEVRPNDAAAFETALAGVPHACIGEVTDSRTLSISDAGSPVVEIDIDTLKEAWQKPLRW
jgi:phosphoribosylformylglycinamidine synthase subunit PurSL